MIGRNDGRRSKLHPLKEPFLRIRNLAKRSKSFLKMSSTKIF